MESVQARLQQAVDEGRVPGLQYVAVDATGVLAEFSLGWADLDHRRPMRSDTTLMAYSMSKTITAIAVLQLAEAGRLQLDEPAARYYPALPYGEALTVRQLLAHTAGVPNPIPLRWVHPVAAHHTFDERAALEAVLRAHPRLAHSPGTKFRYSNIGYWLLGAAVEAVTTVPFSVYVTEHIIRPLGLGARDLGFTIGDRDCHASGYVERWSAANLLARWLIDRELLGPYAGAWRQIADHYPNGPAFGGLVGTARAFAVLLQDQLRPHSALLGHEARRWLYAEATTTAGGPVPMTLGWHVADKRGALSYFKEGGGGGFHCLMQITPARGFGSVIMTNATTFDVTRLLNAVDDPRS